MNHDAKILFVDDDPNILSGYLRQLRKLFRVDTAEGALEGLRLLERAGPYAVVVSDMRMPNMNGIRFLQRVRAKSPDTVRLMLTGNADQQTAVDALNQGCVFRFLTKPCSPESMTATLTAALEQYALVTAEKELLSKTLSGSVNLLADVLSMLNPPAFGRAGKIRRLCSELCTRLNVANAWEVTIAATLALVGCITIPEQVLNRLQIGESLTPEERELLDGHPAVGSRLITRIPRLEGVAEIVRRQNEPYRVTAENGDEDRIGLAANLLKAAIDFEMLVSRGLSNGEALFQMAQDPETYRPSVVKALGECVPVRRSIRLLPISELQDGMILDEHLMSLRGDLLLARGSEISAAMRERLASLSNTSRGVKEPIRVLCPM